MKRLTLFLLWILVVLGGYYYAHKPLDVLQALALLRVGGRLLSAGLYLTVAGGLGARLWRADEMPPLPRAVLQLGIGLGALAGIWLLVGLAGVWRPLTAWGLLLAGLGLLRRPVRAWWTNWRTLPGLWRGAGRFERVLWGGLAVFAGMHLLYALAPPLRWDALMYHLEIPRRYLLAGRFTFLPQNPYWGQPQLGALTYTWLMALGGASAAVVLGWGVLVLLTLGLLAAWRPLTGRRAALVGVTVLFLGLTWQNMLSWGYVDVFAALYGGCFLLMVLYPAPRRTALWGGIFLGLAAWSKLTALILFPLAVFLPVEDGAPVTDWRAGMRRLHPLLVGLAVFAPWPLLSAAWTGNPLYPQVWPTQWVDAGRLAYFSYQAQPIERSLHLLIAPLSAVWFGLDGAAFPGAPVYGADLGAWLVLLALPGLWRAWHAGKRALGAWLALWWGGMALGGTFSPLLVQPRLYFVLFPGLGLLAAYGWRELARTRAVQVRLGRIAAALLVFSLMLTVWMQAHTFVNERPFAPVLGAETEDACLVRNLGAYAQAMQALSALPPDSRPLMLWEPRGLYAPPQADADVWIDRWYMARRAGASPDAILEAWRAAGYTHLLLYRAGADFEFAIRPQLSPADQAALDDLLSRLPNLADFDGVYALYALR
ncbi:MAG: hypothetical protein Fur0018_12890 [Anaerolineales bacterium]